MQKSYNNLNPEKKKEDKKDATEIKLFVASIIIFVISLIFFYHYQNSKNNVVYKFSYDSETTTEQTVATSTTKTTTRKSSKTNTTKVTTKKSEKPTKTLEVTAKTVQNKTKKKEAQTEKDYTDEPEIVEPPSFPLDINSVTHEQLLFIPNVGEKIAEDIINYRNSIGSFYNMENLLEIDGIGQKRLKLLSDYLYVSEQDYREITQPVQELQEITTTQTTNITTETTTTTTTIETTTPLPSQEESPIRQSVNINAADPKTIAECLLIDIELAEQIQTLSQNLGGITNINELLLIEDMPKSLIVELQDYMILE